MGFREGNRAHYGWTRRADGNEMIAGACTLSNEVTMCKSAVQRRQNVLGNLQGNCLWEFCSSDG